MDRLTSAHRWWFSLSLLRADKQCCQTLDIFKTTNQRSGVAARDMDVFLAGALISHPEAKVACAWIAAGGGDAFLFPSLALPAAEGAFTNFDPLGQRLLGWHHSGDQGLRGACRCLTCSSRWQRRPAESPCCGRISSTFPSAPESFADSHLLRIPSQVITWSFDFACRMGPKKHLKTLQHVKLQRLRSCVP